VADSAATPYVFLDTEVFRAHQLDFQSPNIRRLVRLAAEGPVRLLLTTVTRGEVMDDLKGEAQKALKKLKEVRRDARVMRKIMPGDAVDAIEAVKRDDASGTLCKEFDDFMAETRAVILDVGTVSPEAIFMKYFEGIPPFGGGGDNKKFEFPDAFACGALEAWSAANKDANVYVVSNDGDWKKMCGLNPALISVAKLEELLQHFTDSEVSFAIKKGLEEKREELLKLVRAEAENLEFYIGGDQLVDGEIESHKILEVGIEDFNVVEIPNGEASVSLSCQVSVSADVVADDPDSGIYDHETKDMYYAFRMAGTVARTVNLTAEVTVKSNKDDPQQVTIESVEFEEGSVELFVDEHELERVDDNDYPDDMEPNERTQGTTGEQVVYGGQYAAVGCCRIIKKLNQGDAFPACPQHDNTTWGWIPPGSAIGLADAT